MKYKEFQDFFNNGKLAQFNNKIQRFGASKWFSITMFIGSVIIMLTHQEILGTYILALVAGITLFAGDDLLPTFESILVIACFAIRNKHSADEYFKIWYLVIPLVIMILIHFLVHHNRLIKFGTLPGMVAASVAILLGGVGSISAKEYFSGTSIFYMLSLGFAMILVVSYFSDSFVKQKDNDFEKRFARIFVNVIFILAFAVLQYYASHFKELMSQKTILAFQWRNNASSLLMIAMPFAFYFAEKKYRWTFVAILDLLTIVLTGSRGGLLFGTVEFAICFIVMVIIDKKHRKNNYILLGIAFVCLAASTPLLIKILKYTLDRFADPEQNSIRIGLIKAGINDFRTHPINGTGLAYMGNNGIHNNAEHTLCWYHNSIIQVIGSMGIIGIIAYGYLNCLRIKILKNNISFFNIIIFISFIGIEMMSLVNPGVFAPFPYLFIVSLYFVIMEKCNTEDKEKLKIMIRGTDK